MKIQGIGMVSSVGRGVESFEVALQHNPALPKSSVYSSVTNKAIPVFSIDDSILKDKDVLKGARRSDRFCKMAVLSARDAFVDSGIQIDETEKIGVIVATSFGPHKTTFNFLDDILDYGEAGVSPTVFSHSVHNAAASYITSALNIKGPVCTLTNFCFPFHEACKLADAWMNQGRCKHVLVGTVDELSSAMEYICDQKLNIDSEEGMNPFAFSKESHTIPGEGSVFFLLSKDDEDSKYCRIECVEEQKDVDIMILESDGMMRDESEYKEVARENDALFNCSPLFGGIMSSTSFHCASAALMIKNNCTYPKFSKDSIEKEISSVTSFKFGCDKNKAIIYLTK